MNSVQGPLETDECHSNCEIILLNGLYKPSEAKNLTNSVSVLPESILIETQQGFKERSYQIK